MPINLFMKHITSLLAIILLSGCTPKSSSTPHPVILGNDSVYMQLSEPSFSITQFNNDEKFTL